MAGERLTGLQRLYFIKIYRSATDVCWDLDGISYRSAFGLLNHGLV